MVKTPRSPVTTGLVLNYLVYLFLDYFKFWQLQFSQHFEEYSVMCTILFPVDYTSTSIKVQNLPFIAKASICYTFCAKVCKPSQSSPLLELLVVLHMLCYQLDIESALLTFFIFCLCLVVAVEMAQVGDVVVSHEFPYAACLVLIDQIQQLWPFQVQQEAMPSFKV